MATGIIKHSYTPATAEEIQRAVGVTEGDRKAVNSVLTKLRFNDAPAATGRFIRAVDKPTKSVAAKKTKSTAKKAASRKRPE